MHTSILVYTYMYPYAGIYIHPPTHLPTYLLKYEHIYMYIYIYYTYRMVEDKDRYIHERNSRSMNIRGTCT